MSSSKSRGLKKLPLKIKSCDLILLSGIRLPFESLSQSLGQITHALLTRSPLFFQRICRSFIKERTVRLACIRHTASVRPEPGSNSPWYLKLSRSENLVNLHVLEFNHFIILFGAKCSILAMRYLVFKEHKFQKVLKLKRLYIFCQYFI